MKNMKTLLSLSLSLLFVSCIKETKTVSKETNSSTPSCVLTNTCTTTTPPTTTTTTGSAGGGSNGSDDSHTSWGHLYPNGIPTGSCQAAIQENNPNSNSNLYPTRKALITSSAAYSFFKPNEPITASYVNTDPQLKTEAGTLQFFRTDSHLQVRIKVLPEPVSAKTGETVCKGRLAGSTSDGYTKMQITPSVLGIREVNGVTVREEIPLETLEIAVNSCNTPAIDLSGYKAMFPKGVYLQVNTVLLNVGANKSFVAVPKTKCWQIQYEVATDSTYKLP